MSDARRLYGVFQRAGVDCEIIEWSLIESIESLESRAISTDTNGAERAAEQPCEGELLGYGVCLGGWSSYLRRELPPSVFRESPEPPYAPLSKMLNEYYRPKLNSHILFALEADARGYLANVAALSYYVPKLFESVKLTREIGVYRVAWIAGSEGAVRNSR